MTVSSRINNDACYVCACDDSVVGTETVLYRGQLVRTALQHCIGARWPLSERERKKVREVRWGREKDREREIA